MTLYAYGRKVHAVTSAMQHDVKGQVDMCQIKVSCSQHAICGRNVAGLFRYAIR